ncbi:hypothetical protein BGX24_009248 [Mortierella sp. AD032]|nr:hypothetical protein BGX24_009248 [Mortierella sp. AD032]
MSSVILDNITTVPGLSHLTIDGYIPDSPMTYSQFLELMASHPLLEGVHNAEKDHLFRLLTFASQETVPYFDILTLDMEDCRKLFKIYFKMSRDHVLAANLQLTWSDDTLAGNHNDPPAPATTPRESYLQDVVNEADENEHVAAEVEYQHAYDHINTYTNNHDDEPLAENDNERIFTWFLTVEHLYLIETGHFKRFIGGARF